MNNNENNKENINKNELGEVSGGLSTSDENMKEPRPFCGAGDLKFPIKTIDPKTGKISGKDEKNKKEGLSDNDLNAASGGTILEVFRTERVKDPETGEWKIMRYNESTGEWEEWYRLPKKNIDPETTEPKNTNGIKT